ncbi:MAG: hypothetical protein HY867_09360 [Chloroflexi bacterium]|nr:hypothetical protein [Chloroflexota bacterium]
MVSLVIITQIEQQYVEKGCQTLGSAFTMLQHRWKDGARDKETALRLLFLAWYSCSEPDFLTGLDEDLGNKAIFINVFTELGGMDCQDPEVCFTVGFMAETFPWCIGDEKSWEQKGLALRTRGRELKPNGYPPAHFEGRGAYGNYFSHMARIGAL